MRLATYNVEWFDALFDDAGGLLDDDGKSGRQGVARGDQLAALGIVFTALDADAVMVVEAPDGNGRRSTVTALENFARAFGIRARRALVGFQNHTRQEIALLYDPDRICCRHDPQGAPTGPTGAAGAPRFDGVLRIDLDIDATEDLVVFSKPPLEVTAKIAEGTRLRIIGAHLKSKAPYGARNHDEIMRLGIANRRKQLAQAIWLRRRVEEHLEAGCDVIVMGDLNDGPGLDEYEDLFGRSSVEIVMGEGADTRHRLYDPHARRALAQRIGAMPATARFWIEQEGHYLQALLDYMLASEGILARGPKWRIWHPFDDPGCWRVPELREALLTASDHFPVSMDVAL